jgi:hypothetical protein
MDLSDEININNRFDNKRARNENWFDFFLISTENTYRHYLLHCTEKRLKI